MKPLPSLLLPPAPYGEPAQPKVLPDPKRPDLDGLRPALIKKLHSRRKLLEKVGAPIDPLTAPSAAVSTSRLSTY